MEKSFVQEFALRHYELDHRGVLSMPYLCRIFQEAAGHHAERLGFALSQLEPLDLAWVLARFHVRLADEARLPGWRDTVRVETWRAGIERMFAIRDYRLLNAAGNVLAVGTSHWTVIDVARRRPAPFPKFITDAYPADLPRALDAAYDRLPGVSEVDYEARVQVRTSDIDANNHVNNVAYLIWALDTVPQTVSFECRPMEIELLFRAEALLGDQVSVMTQKLPTPDDPTFAHKLARVSDGRELVLARTRWAAPTFD